jgi:hypothetical protein
METLKNFLLGMFVVLLSLVILVVVYFTWPFLIGITSLMLSVIAGILFFVLIFYIIVLIGHVVRQLITKQR